MIDPDSVKQILEDELQQPSMRKWIGGSVNVFILRKYRNWKEHHDRNSPVNLDTGFEKHYVQYAADIVLGQRFLN